MCEAHGGLIELGLAFVGRLSLLLYVFLLRFLVGLLGEEKRGLYLYFFLDWVLVFIGPVVVRLLVKGIPPPVRG